jgi:5-methylcytosine-specific restriction enzyme subunit McrC
MHTTSTPTIRHGLHDLLIEMLANEVEELVSRGLARRYVSQFDKLEAPRGRILIGELARGGGITEARLPCRHFNRSVNWHLNRILLAGLGAAAQMTEDGELRRRLYRLSGAFDGIDHPRRIEIGEIDRAERALTRLTQANASALTIVRLLKSMQGTTFEPTTELVRTSGFLFDMNSFFQRLLSRFFREYLSIKTIVDERSIRAVFAYSPDANPKGHAAPRPRPDYALFHANSLCGFLDAKYRDVWERGLPADWLYQLSVYALASPLQVSVLLYATMSAQAQDERIEIRQPVAWSANAPASVILRPVFLPRLAELLHPDQSGGDLQRRLFADQLVVLDTLTQPIMAHKGDRRAA